MKKSEKRQIWDQRKIYPMSSKVDAFIKKLEREKASILKKYPEVKPTGITVTTIELRKWNNDRDRIEREMFGRKK